MAEQKTIVDKTFKDKHGKIAIAQVPNLPLIVWIVAKLLATVVKHGTLHRLANNLAFGALFAWAWIELFQGVNYFRRALGALVLLGLIASKIN